MSAITRGWTIPVTSSCPEITLQIHEPPLTEDNLGLKTWASSYLMAKRLETIGAKHLGSLLQEPQNMRGLELVSDIRRVKFPKLVYLLIEMLSCEEI